MISVMLRWLLRKECRGAQLALDMYAYSVKKYIGSYAAAMGGENLIVLTRGIGENDYDTRKGY